MWIARRGIAWVGGLLALAACSAEAGEPSAAPTRDVTRTSEHFRVTCHGVDGAVADASLAAAEAAWASVEELFSELAPSPPGRLLQVHVYARAEDMAEVDAKYGGLLFARFGMNFTNWAEQSAYVYLGPTGCDDVVSRAGVTWEIRRSVAHEAAHLATFERLGFTWVRSEWLVEGLALHAEDEALAKLGWSAGVQAEPSSSTYMERCVRLRRAGALPAPRKILTGLDPGGGIPEACDRYALHWAMFRFLLEAPQRGRTLELLERARRIPDGPDFGRRLLAAAVGLWGDEGLDAMGDAFGKYVDGFAPEWDAVWGRLSTSGTRWIVTSHPRMGGAFRAAAAGRKTYTIGGTFESVPNGEDTGVFVLLGRTAGGLIAVGFVPGSGVQVYEGRNGKDPYDVTWNWIAGESADKPAVRAKNEFEVFVDRDVLGVRLGTKEVLRTIVRGRDLTGAWGVGVGAGGVAIWDHVELR